MMALFRTGATMSLLITSGWRDYELLDAGGAERLERWGEFVLRRPDPQVLWPRALDARAWERADAVYHRSASGGGRWEFRKRLPERWSIRYEVAGRPAAGDRGGSARAGAGATGASSPEGAELRFHVRPTGFKHTGLFPEQAANWVWMMDRIRRAPFAAAGGRGLDGHTRDRAGGGDDDGLVRVLNLFAYTGAATVACAAAGAAVTHVDAAKGMVAWAKENLALSGLADRQVRFLVDDVMKFVLRERRRGRQYDAIVMDPPSYGRGTSGETWKIEKALVPLVEAAASLLSERALFFVINSYTTGLSPIVLRNVLATVVAAPRAGMAAARPAADGVSCGEVALPIASSSLVLPCGIYARWESA
jgi:23S rRNA (cytosine1962-C5)-methyltransferase